MYTPAYIKSIVLFDYAQALSVCEDSYEDQEYYALDELHCLSCKTHHCESVVKYSIQQSADNYILKSYLGSAGDRHSAEYESYEDLCLELVTYVSCS